MASPLSNPHLSSVLLRPVLRPRLCYVLQLLAGGCVMCYSFWRGAVLRVTAALNSLRGTHSKVSHSERFFFASGGVGHAL